MQYALPGLLLAAMMWLAFPSLVAATGVVEHFKGIVMDLEEKKPIPGAVVHLVELNKYTVTAADGIFTFDNIPHGEYTLVVTHLAYKSQSAPFSCTGGDPDHEFIVYLSPKAIEFDPIVVTGTHEHTKFNELQALTSVLQGKDLEREMGQSLAATLKNETGVAIRSMGPAPARPVIRGLGGDRVLITEDGTKTADLSATSPDHAVTLEPFSLERVEVVRGPRVLLRSSTTIGGLVNGIRHEIPLEHQERITGSAGVFGESANMGYLGLASVEVPLYPFMIRGEFSAKQASDLSTPAGTLKNSDAQSMNAALGGSFITEGGMIGASYRDFTLDYGIPGGFIGAHPNGVDIEMEKRQYNAQFNHRLHLGAWNLLEAKLSRIYYRHLEFEREGLVGAEFRLIDYIASVDVHHRPDGIFNDGSAGVSMEYREVHAGGFVFTPPAKSTNISVYAVESTTLGRFTVEVGLRAQYDDIRPETGVTQSGIGDIRSRTFETFAASVTAAYRITESISAGANLSRSSRVPTIEELYTEGPHLAAYSFETGNPGLEYERGIGSEAFFKWKAEGWNGTITVFHNALNYYIVPRNTGRINFQTFLPVYASSGVRATMSGAGAELSVRLAGAFSAHTSIAYTHGQNLTDNLPLPQIAPLKRILGIEYSNNAFAAGITAVLAAKQNRVDRFEQPTAGYAVFNASGQYAFVGAALVHNLALSLDNMLNTEYRNHLSRVKSILPEAGRSARLSYKLYFDL